MAGNSNKAWVVTEPPENGGSPEYFFIPHPGSSKASAEDVVYSCITRAKTVLSLLQSDGSDGEFGLSHNAILDVLYTATGLLNMADAALSFRVQKGEA